MIILGFLLGALLGSFVKAIADRSLRQESFLGRSYCPSCKHKLSWLDLFPILSYLFLRGRCRYCGKKISLEYPGAEAVMGVLVSFMFFYFPPSALPFPLFFVTVLAIIFLTDFKKYFIPDKVMLPSILIALLWQPQNILAGALLGGFFTLLIILTRGKGMGGGDVKLGAFMGLGLGLYNGILAVMLAFFIGAIWGLGAIILGKKKFKEHIPFGPFLVLGSAVALFWGNEIIRLYLR